MTRTGLIFYCDTQRNGFGLVTPYFFNRLHKLNVSCSW